MGLYLLALWWLQVKSVQSVTDSDTFTGAGLFLMHCCRRLGAVMICSRICAGQCGLAGSSCCQCSQWMIDS